MYDPRDRVFSSSNALHVSAPAVCVRDRRGALRTDRAVVRGRAITRCSSSVTGVCMDSKPYAAAPIEAGSRGGSRASTPDRGDPRASLCEPGLRPGRRCAADHCAMGALLIPRGLCPRPAGTAVGVPTPVSLRSIPRALCPRHSRRGPTPVSLRSIPRALCPRPAGTAVGVPPPSRFARSHPSRFARNAALGLRLGGDPATPTTVSRTLTVRIADIPSGGSRSRRAAPPRAALPRRLSQSCGGSRGRRRRTVR
jgi:hypothetical protein